MLRNFLSPCNSALQLLSNALREFPFSSAGCSVVPLTIDLCSSSFPETAMTIWGSHLSVAMPANELRGVWT